MGADRRRWYQVGNRTLRRKVEGGRDYQDRTVDHARSENPTPTAHDHSAVDHEGAMVARSQVVVSGSTVTLLGTMTNETGRDVHFSGVPPYATTLDTDGSQPILFGDFNSPPRERPSSGDWVMHPGASVPYRSLPVTVQTPDARWDGGDWCLSSRSTTLDIMRSGNARELPTIHLFADRQLMGG